MATQVLLDLTPLVTRSTHRGIGRYVRGLVAGLAETGWGRDQGLDVQGFVASESVTRLSVTPDALAYTERPAQPPVASSNHRRTWLVSLGLQTLRSSREALLHLAEPPGIPWFERRRFAITCHDLISLALPGLYLPPIPKWQLLYAGIERVRYGKATRVLAVSHATKRDLCAHVGVPEDHVDVVWHGVDHGRFHARAAEGERTEVSRVIGTDAPYLFYLGAGDPRKDLDTLVTAFARSRARNDCHLIVAGGIREERAVRLRARSRELGIADRAHFLGYVDERIVPALYRQSRLHVFPSRYEGFGLPVLEALACGTPTITSPGSSLDEVAGDAAKIVHCGDADALTAAIDEVAFDEDTRSALRGRGLLRAQEFTWRRCAEETLAFWQRSLARA